MSSDYREDQASSYVLVSFSYIYMVIFCTGHAQKKYRRKKLGIKLVDSVICLSAKSSNIRQSFYIDCFSVTCHIFGFLDLDIITFSDTGYHTLTFSDNFNLSSSANTLKFKHFLML